MAERTRQHREMRLKGNAELKERVEELKSKLRTERDRMQKDFEGQVSVASRRRHGTTRSALRTTAADDTSRAFGALCLLPKAKSRQG